MKNTCGIALAILFCCSHAARAGLHEWKSNGPDGGTIMALAIDPQTPSRLYCGAYRGGIYKSVDSGETWISANPALNEAVVRAIAIDPKHPDTVFVGAEIGGLFRTTDAGATWTDVSPTYEFISSIAIDPVHTDTIYVGTLLDGVFKSRNGGATWLSVSSGLGEAWIQAIAIDPSEPTHLFASTVYGAGVYRSLNGGGSWLPAAVGLPEESTVYGIAVDPRSPATIYAGVDRGQHNDADVYRSTDDGLTWTPTGLGASAYSLTAAPDGAVYAATGRGVWKIRNGIDHCVAVNGDSAGLIAYAIGVNPENVAVIHVGGIGGVFRTMDRGAHWKSTTKGIRNTEVWAIATDPHDPAIVYAGTIGAGVAKSRDAGTTWIPSGPGLTQPFVSALAVDPTAAGTLFAGAFRDVEGDAFKSTDGGASWHASASSPIGAAVVSLAIDPANPQTIYAGAWPGVFRSDDGGLHWNLVGQQYGQFSVGQIVIDPIQTSTVYVATSHHGVVKSTDRGDHWNFSGGYISSLAIDPTDPQVLYASIYPDLLRKSTNAGWSWTSIGEPLEGHLRQILAIVVDPDDSQNVYVAGWDGVFRSADGGATWTDMNIPGIAIIQALTLDGAGAFLHAGTWTNGVMSYQLHFLDATSSHPFRAAIEAVALAGISSGCGAGRFCPGSPLSRAQASVWLLRAMHGAAYAPAPATGNVFSDVPADAFAAAWIEQLAAEGITTGCGAPGFCPAAATTRAQLAVWLLRAKHGPTYAPPPATGLVFADVAADSFAAAWIEALAAEGISSGCGGGNYCPEASAARGDAAHLFVRTFELD